MILIAYPQLFGGTILHGVDNLPNSVGLRLTGFAFGICTLLMGSLDGDCLPQIKLRTSVFFFRKIKDRAVPTQILATYAFSSSMVSSAYVFPF